MNIWIKCSSPFVVGNYIPLLFFLSHKRHAQFPTASAGTQYRLIPKWKSSVNTISYSEIHLSTKGSTTSRYQQPSFQSSDNLKFWCFFFFLCPRTHVLSPSSQRYRDTKGKHEDKCFSIPLSWPTEPNCTAHRLNPMWFDTPTTRHNPGEFIFSTEMCSAHRPRSLWSCYLKQKKNPRPWFAA